MAISHVAEGALKETASGNIASVGLPAGPTAGDLMTCWLVGADNIVSTQANWTLKLGVNAGTKLRGELWYRRWITGDTAPTFTRTSGGAAIARISLWRGVIASGDPFDGVPTSQANTLTTTITAPTITPGGGNTADALLLLGAEELSADTSGAPVIGNFGGTVPTPAQIYASRATGLGADMVSEAISWGLKTDASATGARTAAVTGEAASPTNVLGMSALLLPAAAAVVLPQHTLIVAQAVQRAYNW